MDRAGTRDDAARLRERVRLLLWRAHLGATPALVDVYTANARAFGYPAIVAQLLNYPDETAEPPVLPAYPLTLPTQSIADEARAYERARFVLQAARNDAYYEGMSVLRRWWLDRFLRGLAPLQENLTLFWHDHFATNSEKVGRPHFMRDQNQLFRALGAGRFGTLVAAVAKDPAMLVWLDGRDSVRGAPNENWARELLELFTVGIGNFTERDVRETARACTGWTLDYESGAVRFDPRRFDAGQKTLLGTTGNLGLEDAVWIAATHPVTARNMCGKLFAWFVADDPTDADLAPMLTAWEASGGTIRDVLRAMFLSPSFAPERATRAHVKHPLAWAVGAARSLGATMSGEQLGVLLAAQEMTPFLPPSVGGWPRGLAWVSPTSQMTRFNAAAQFAEAVVWSPVLDDAHRRLTDRLLALPAWDDVRGLRPTAARDDDPLFLHELADRLGLPPLDSGLHAKLLALGRQGPDGWRTVLQVLLASPAYQTA